jgi:hypothetical protein
LPWSTTFDLGGNTKSTISGNNKLELRADIFNIFNAENLSGYSNATKVTKFSLAPVDCLHKEMHRHRDSFSLEFVIYSNKTNILLVGMALQDVLIC